MEPVDFSPLLVYLDRQIAEASEELLKLRAMRAELLRAAQPGPPAPEPPPTPPGE